MTAGTVWMHMQLGRAGMHTGAKDGAAADGMCWTNREVEALAIRGCTTSPNQLHMLDEPLPV